MGFRFRRSIKLGKTYAVEPEQKVEWALAQE